VWKVPLQELSLFFPCHNEADNLEGLVADALAALPALATTYEVILVDDGARDGSATVGIPSGLVAYKPVGVVQRSCAACLLARRSGVSRRGYKIRIRRIGV